MVWQYVKYHHQLINKKIMRIYIIFVLLLLTQLVAGKDNKQNLTSPLVPVSGIIQDQQGHPLAGASIFQKATNRGCTADKNGKFMLLVDPGYSFQVSFIGYESQDIRIGNQREFPIILKETSLLLEDVIITALGLQRKESGLTYATEKIDKDELIRVKDPNLIVTLMGKISGVEINKSASGIGGSAKVSLRGIRSVAGNNQRRAVFQGDGRTRASPADG